MNTAATGVNLEGTLQYGNHPSVNKHLPAIWKKIDDYVRRKKCLEIQKSASLEILNLRVFPLAAVVTHKVRIISFDEQSRGQEGGLNGDTDPDTVPQYPCTKALPKFFTNS